MSKFQIIFLGSCVALGVAGLLFFSVYKGKNQANNVNLVIWSTLDQNLMSPFFTALTKQAGTKITTQYFQDSPAKIYQDYLEALAVGRGPDLLIIDDSQLMKFSNKLLIIPYSTISQATFKSSYVQEAEEYLGTQGISALPFTIDPIVMYWNRDLFTNALITTPPKVWDDLISNAPRLTKKDAANNITTSAVAMGEYQNIEHAKEILSLIMLQVGNPIISTSDSTLSSTLGLKRTDGTSQTADALDFYTQFANPTKRVYSWNRSLPDSKTLFISNKLGIYFGYASEFSDIQTRNPNLNFDVAMVPQTQVTNGGQPILLTYGKLYGISIAKSTQNYDAAVSFAELLSSQAASQMWSDKSGLPLDRRDSLDFNTSNARISTFSTAAFWSRDWIDPNPTATNQIFQGMIENVTSGRLAPIDAVGQADQQMNNLLPQSQ